MESKFGLEETQKIERQLEGKRKRGPSNEL